MEIRAPRCTLQAEERCSSTSTNAALWPASICKVVDNSFDEALHLRAAANDDLGMHANDPLKGVGFGV